MYSSQSIKQGFSKKGLNFDSIQTDEGEKTIIYVVVNGFFKANLILTQLSEQISENSDTWTCTSAGSSGTGD